MSKDIVVQGKTSLKVEAGDRRSDINFVAEKFRIADAVDHLHSMMKEVTKTEVNAKNVNAACHCIHQLNETINTTITAARFLREK